MEALNYYFLIVEMFFEIDWYNVYMLSIHYIITFWQ